MANIDDENAIAARELLTRYFDTPSTIIRLSTQAVAEHMLSRIDREVVADFPRATRALSFPAFRTYRYTGRDGRERTANGFYEWVGECDRGDNPLGSQNRCYDLLPRGSVVVYDLEWWNGPNAMPSLEDLDPARYLRLFSSLAHHYGWKVLFTTGDQIAAWTWANRYGRMASSYPLPPLTKHGCVENPNWNRLLSARVFAETAPYTDFWNIQRQGIQHDRREFVCDVAAAAAQIRQASPTTVVLMEIGTDPGREAWYHIASAEGLWSMYSEARQYVDGLFLTIQSPQYASVLLNFLLLSDKSQDIK